MTTTHSPADSTDSHPGAQSWTYWAGRFAVLTAALTVAYVLTIQLEVPWLALGTAEPYTATFAPMLAISVILAVVTALVALPTYRYAVGRCSIRSVDLTVPILYLIAPIVFTLALLVYVVAVGDGIPSQTLTEHLEEFGEFFAVWYAGTLLPALAVAAVYASWRRRVSMTPPRAVALALVVLLVVGGGPVAAAEIGLTDGAGAGDSNYHYYTSERTDASPDRGLLACSNERSLRKDALMKNTEHGYALPDYEVAQTHEVRGDVYVSEVMATNQTSNVSTRDGFFVELRENGTNISDERVVTTTVYHTEDGLPEPIVDEAGFPLTPDSGQTYWVAWDIVEDGGEVHRYLTRLCAPRGE